LAPCKKCGARRISFSHFSAGPQQHYYATSNQPSPFELAQLLGLPNKATPQQKNVSYPVLIILDKGVYCIFQAGSQDLAKLRSQQKMAPFCIIFIIFIALFLLHFLIIFIQLFLQMKAYAEAEDEAWALAETASVGVRRR